MMCDPIDNRIGPNFGRPLSKRRESELTAERDALLLRVANYRSLLDSAKYELEWLTAYHVVQEGGKDWKNTLDGSAFFDCDCSENGGYMEWDTNAYIHAESCASGHEVSLGALHDQINAALSEPDAGAALLAAADEMYEAICNGVRELPRGGMTAEQQEG